MPEYVRKPVWYFQGGVMSSEVNFEAQLKSLGCFADFEKMESCLGEFERDWRACQDQVKVFKSCMKDKAIHLSANITNNDKP
jgi:hypothetical protein